MQKALGVALAAAVAAMPLAGAPARADGGAARALLQQELTDRVPKPWQVHVTWRDATLLAFVTPYPYQTAFDLWYAPEKLRAAMLALCPAPGDAVWAELAPGQSIAVEPTVGGKGGESLRLVCPRTGKPQT